MNMGIKKILDSVHGYIDIDDEYIKNIVDTLHFQRLRRIEQTSTRAIFPSARHDRFIHSLGVFYIGKKIIEQIKKVIDENHYDIPNEEEIFESYLIACLLHDIAHAPFSHTFEGFYDANKNTNLREILCSIIKSDQFRSDWESVCDPSAPHERMSAIVAVNFYNEFIIKKGGNLELIARMIIGLHYSDPLHTFENAMIELIHGDIIDADGLDYVCRDVWASGYYTTMIDLERLIDSIRIIKDSKGYYNLCYKSKCINEIESVIRVKTFQQFYVINHHTVTYEQRLLKKSMESAALYHFEGKCNVESQTTRYNALCKLCDIKSFYVPSGEVGITTNKTNIKIANPKDDDFVSLMGYIRSDKYINQWLSRSYNLKPLWKSKADFYYYFEQLRDIKLLQESWIFSDDCKKFLSRKFGIPNCDIWIERATPKYKYNYISKTPILVDDNKIINYDKLFPKDYLSYNPPVNEFYYIYVPKNMNSREIIDSLKKQYLKYFMSIS